MRPFGPASLHPVMPVETGIQTGLAMDSRVRGNDIQERTPSSDAITRRWQARQ